MSCCRNIAGLDELQVYRTKGSTEWNLLMDIRNGKLEYDIAREHIDRLDKMRCEFG